MGIFIALSIHFSLSTDIAYLRMLLGTELQNVGKVLGIYRFSSDSSSSPPPPPTAVILNWEWLCSLGGHLLTSGDMVGRYNRDQWWLEPKVPLNVLHTQHSPRTKHLPSSHPALQYGDEAPLSCLSSRSQQVEARLMEKEVTV